MESDAHADRDTHIQEDNLTFELAATGRYSLNKLSQMLYRKGLRSIRVGTKLTKQGVARVLRNPIYHGEFVWKDRRYCGTHEPLINRQLFNDVQKAMGFVQKQRLTRHDFLYSGLLTCGHCGCAITAERKNKRSGKTYIYYHCTNGKGICDNVVYLREEKLDATFAGALKAIDIPGSVVELTREALLESSRDERTFREAEVNRLSRRYKKLDQFLSRAYEDRLEGHIDLELWEEKSSLWKREQADILGQIESLKKANTSYMEEGLQLMELAQQAHTLFLEMTPDEKRDLLNLVLSNPQILDGKLNYFYKMPFSLFTNVTDLEIWRGRRDSNSRPPA